MTSIIEYTTRRIVESTIPDDFKMDLFFTFDFTLRSYYNLLFNSLESIQLNNRGDDEFHDIVKHLRTVNLVSDFSEYYNLKVKNKLFVSISQQRYNSKFYKWLNSNDSVLRGVGLLYGITLNNPYI
ncbi:MAG: hypothetical protein IPK46_21920 [Saprospiraceae bacterium]|nr:hypothetical protein [Saprospiraceae bacterium]